MLFKKLPDDIFRPLAGANKHLFVDVLKSLYALFFDEDNPDSDAPRKDVVMGVIIEVLAVQETLALKEDDGGDTGLVYNTVDTAADYMFRRLVNTGWLDIEEDGYNINIVPNQGARLLLSALLDIEAHEKKSYGRTVVSILAHIEAAIQNPKERGIVFLDAMAQAREFSNHLRGILYSLKEVQDVLAKMKDPRLVLAHFFDEFVENILIADYKTLYSTDNPFRYRHAITTKLQHIERMDQYFTPISEAYQEHYHITPDDASARLRRDIEFIAKVFRSVDRRLKKIDDFCRRLESRVGETVRFIDRTMPGMSNRIADLLCALGERQSVDEVELPAPPLLKQVRLVGPFSIYNPPGKKEKPSPQVLRERVINPDIKRHKDQIRAYLKKRAFEPHNVTGYLDRQMGNKTVMSASEFQIETVDDLLAFMMIRFLPRMHGRGQITARQFHIVRRNAAFENDYIRCNDFSVERRKNA